jgi:hypothetical protein
MNGLKLIKAQRPVTYRASPMHPLYCSIYNVRNNVYGLKFIEAQYFSMNMYHTLPLVVNLDALLVHTPPLATGFPLLHKQSLNVQQLD